MDPKVSITYTNANGLSMTISSSGPYRLKSMAGFGMAENKITSEAVYGADGEQELSQALDIREPEIDFLMLSSSFEENQSRWNYAMKVFNPKLSGTLEYRVLDATYHIDVNVVKGPEESDGMGANYHMAIVQFKALDPYWHDMSDFSSPIPLSKMSNTFIFPLQITDSYTFSTVVPGQIIDITNNGDTVVGGVFNLTMKNTVVNPEIYNVVTQEYFGWVGTFNPGDVLTLSTVFKQKSTTYVTADDVTSNAMGMRKAGSTFLQLDNISDNYLQLQADSGVEGIIGTLEFKPLKVGV